MATYTIEALDTGGNVVATATAEATGPGVLGTVSGLFPSLADGDYTFRAFTPETGVYTVASDTTAPVVSSFVISTTVDDVHISARVEDEAASTDLYFVYTVDSPQTYGAGDGDLIAQGLLADGVTPAPLASGPFNLPSGTDVDITDDISSLSDGTVYVYATAVDPAGNYAAPVSDDFVRDPPLSLFTDDFSTEDGALASRTGWELLYKDTNSTATVGLGVLTLSASKSDDRLAHYTTEAVSSANQYSQFTLTSGAGSSGRILLGLRVTPFEFPADYEDFTGYFIEIDRGGTPDITLERRDASSKTVLASTSGYDIANGDVIKLQAINVDDGAGGTNTEFKVFNNGGEIPALTFTEVGTTYPDTGSAAIGWFGFVQGSIDVDNFEFGNTA